MKELNFYLKQSLRWITFEALSYQLILLGHQIALSRICSCTLYGLIGTIFSLVYLFVTITDIGLEASISPFFCTIVKGKDQFKRFFRTQLKPNILSVSLFFVLALTIKILLDDKIALLNQISIPLLFVLAALVLSENIKKTLRTAMHLAFLNQSVACIEFGTIICYTATIWLLYWTGSAISLKIIFLPMLTTSIISNGFMVFFLHRFAKKLPKFPKKLQEVKKGRIIKNRGFNYLNQLSHMLFSSNFLVPFFAMQFGLAHAGIFKLISHIAYCTTTILRKTFGITSDALLAKTKEMTWAAKRSIFLQVTQKVHHALYGVIFFFAINYKKIIAFKATGNEFVSGPVVYLFLIICLSEIFFIAYEKFYITQEKTGRLLTFNIATMLLTYGAIRYATNFSKSGLLLLIISIRAGMFALLSLASFYTWQIKPQWRLKKSYVAIALGISFGFFMLF